MTKSSASSLFGFDLSAIAIQWNSFRRSISQRYLLLEFRNDSLLFSEASFRKSKINYSHVGIQSLPEGAVELGVPVEPEKMSGLLQQICKENGINVHRCAVVLPPEASFTTLVRLPSSLSAEEAWDFIQSPDSALQIPIPLQQTDFDLIPLQHLWQPDEFESLYLLSGVPKTLVDSLIETLNLAGLELSDLCLAMTAQARILCSQIVSLSSNSYILVLEFSAECTNALVLSASGPVSASRIASIREFPEPEVSEEILASALLQPLAAESMILAEDRYLPISELDIQVLVKETKILIKEFNLKNENCLWDHVYLSGSGSSHPGLEALLHNALELPVSILRASEASGIGTISMDSLLLSQSLGRLLGLGLHLMPDQMILRSSETSIGEFDMSSTSYGKKSFSAVNSRLISASIVNELDSSGQTNEDGSTESLQHVSQNAISDQLKHDKKELTGSNLAPISTVSSSEKLSLGVEKLSGDECQELDENAPFDMSVNIEELAPAPDELDSNVSTNETTVDHSFIGNESDNSGKIMSNDLLKPNHINHDSDLDSRLSPDVSKQSDENIPSFYVEKTVEINPTESELVSTTASPLSLSTDSQGWPSIRDNTIKSVDTQKSASGNLISFEDDRDVPEGLSSNINVATSETSAQIDLRNETNEGSSASCIDGVVSSIELSNESSFSSEDDVRDTDTGTIKPDGLGKNQDSVTLVSSQQMNWPSIRDVQASNENELNQLKPILPDDSIDLLDSYQKKSPSSDSPGLSVELYEDPNIREDLDPIDQSVVSEQELHEEDETLGELKFTDD